MKHFENKKSEVKNADKGRVGKLKHILSQPVEIIFPPTWRFHINFWGFVICVTALFLGFLISIFSVGGGRDILLFALFGFSVWILFVGLVVVIDFALRAWLKPPHPLFTPVAFEVLGLVLAIGFSSCWVHYLVRGEVLEGFFFVLPAARAQLSRASMSSFDSLLLTLSLPLFAAFNCLVLYRPLVTHSAEYISRWRRTLIGVGAVICAPVLYFGPAWLLVIVFMSLIPVFVLAEGSPYKEEPTSSFRRPVHPGRFLPLVAFLLSYVWLFFWLIDGERPATQDLLSSLLTPVAFLVGISLFFAIRRRFPRLRYAVARSHIYEHLALAVEEDIPLTEAVKSLLTHRWDGVTRRTLVAVGAALERGVSLPESLARSGPFFPKHEITFLNATESDSLPNVLRYLTQSLRSALPRVRSRNLLVLYSLELGVVVLLVAVVLISGLSRMVEIADQSHAELPRFSVIVFGSIELFIERVLTVAVAVALLAMVIARHSARFRQMLARATYPFGDLFWLHSLSRLSFLLAHSLRRGFPLDVAVHTSFVATRDPILARLAQFVGQKICCGVPLPMAILQSRTTPSWFADHLALGMRLESLPPLLEQVSHYYLHRAAELRGLLAKVVGMIYALGVLLLGGCFVVAVYLVLFKISTSIPYE